LFSSIFKFLKSRTYLFIDTSIITVAIHVGFIASLAKPTREKNGEREESITRSNSMVTWLLERDGVMGS